MNIAANLKPTKKKKNMGLLQDPLKTIEQIEWYLTHQELEKFPGAFELAAGNLVDRYLNKFFLFFVFSAACQRGNTSGQMVLSKRLEDS